MNEPNIINHPSSMEAELREMLRSASINDCWEALHTVAPGLEPETREASVAYTIIVDHLIRMLTLSRDINRKVAEIADQAATAAAT